MNQMMNDITFWKSKSNPNADLQMPSIENRERSIFASMTFPVSAAADHREIRVSRASIQG